MKEKEVLKRKVQDESEKVFYGCVERTVVNVEVRAEVYGQKMGQ